MDPFSITSRFPNRRRAVQACVTCSNRKTRCDAVQPRCGYCASHSIECVYRDAQQPRIDYNTQVLLERMQLLEDRVLRDKGEAQQQQQQSWQLHRDIGGASGLDVQMTLSHTANANHVFSWPIVKQLLSQDAESGLDVTGNVTDCFFEPTTSSQHSNLPRSWRLYDDSTLYDTDISVLLDIYFSEVNIFFPLLSKYDIEITMRKIWHDEKGNGDDGNSVSNANYALVLMVLCFALFIQSEGNLVRHGNRHHGTEGGKEGQLLWAKAQLCLGSVCLETSMAAAQTAMITSLYLGARGKIAEAFSWSQIAATKCEVLARYYTRRNAEESAEIPEDFKRLYWIAYIYEGDFVSEISISLPSGIAHYEDLVPYPSSSNTDDSQDPVVTQREQLIAFQITTNASIRRFLNRVNSAVYNAKEQQRQQHDDGAGHAAWLLRISEDLWQHHANVYRNLPEFLLRNDQAATNTTPSEMQPPRMEGLLPHGNNPWNVVRLKGRYYAGQYIIHRPFVEYTLLNSEGFDMHPHRQRILEKCATCLNGCIGFVQVFNVEPANSITCLFATGMVTFTMTIIMMVATTCPLLKDILPAGLDQAIITGQENLKLFSHSIKEFAWHVSILSRLDLARRSHMSSGFS